MCNIPHFTHLIATLHNFDLVAGGCNSLRVLAATQFVVLDQSARRVDNDAR